MNILNDIRSGAERIISAATGRMHGILIRRRANAAKCDSVMTRQRRRAEIRSVFYSSTTGETRSARRHLARALASRHWKEERERQIAEAGAE
jgi:hypothetical protein